VLFFSFGGDAVQSAPAHRLLHLVLHALAVLLLGEELAPLQRQVAHLLVKWTLVVEV